MANETLNANSSAYASCIASAAITTDDMSATGSTIATALSTGSEDLYPTLDFKLKVTAGTVTAGDVINLYRRPSDGTDQAPIPVETSSNTLQTYVGSFTLASNSETRYRAGVRNLHTGDLYYLHNTGAASITMQLYVRGSSYGN